MQGGAAQRAAEAGSAVWVRRTEGTVLAPALAAPCPAEPGGENQGGERAPRQLSTMLEDAEVVKNKKRTYISKR
jgi:hypothetical protein